MSKAYAYFPGCSAKGSCGELDISTQVVAALDIDTLIESTMTPEKVEFKRIREEQGLKAALAWRDAKFKDGDH